MREVMPTPPLLNDAASQLCGCKLGLRRVWAEEVDRDMHRMHHEPSVDCAQAYERLRLRLMNRDMPPLTVAFAPPLAAWDQIRFHYQAPLIRPAQCSK
jgi:hypothetical protein